METASSNIVNDEDCPKFAWIIMVLLGCLDLVRGFIHTVLLEYAAEFIRIMSHDSLLRNDQETLAICRDWENFSTKLFIAYQEQALKELNYEGKELKFADLIRKFKKNKKSVEQLNITIQ